MNNNITIQPKITTTQAIDLVERKYGLYVTNIEEMNGYDDRNFKLETKSTVSNENINKVWPFGYVLKIINSEDSKNIKLIEAQNSLMLYLDRQQFNVTVPILNKNGMNYTLEELENNSGIYHAVKLLTFQPGKLLNDCTPSEELYKNLGTYLADVNIVLENFHHDGYVGYESLWGLNNVCSIRKYYTILENPKQLELIDINLKNFEQNVLPIVSSLEHGIIHGDFNEQNLLTEGDQIKALLDFGDAQYAPYLYEIAICICYVLIHGKDIKFGKNIINGYLKRRSLTNDEQKLLKICVCARLCQSLLLGLYTYSIYKNDYVLGTQHAGWKLLSELTEINENELKEIWDLDYSN